MQPGDLRRFTPYGIPAELAARVGVFGAGDIFMVLEIVEPHGGLRKEVTFLVNSTIMTGWGLLWIMNNSEVLNEAR